jgi:type IV secretory pathway TrbL component
MNMSIFAIDAIISLSNAMISAIETAYGSLSIWDALKSVADTAGAQGFVSLLVMVVFMILSVILLVYYVMRIVTLYIGAVLSPVVALLQVVPGFKDFTMTALKVYVSNIFVLFVHVIILTLAATLFNGLRLEGADPPYDPVMAMIVGVAALITLLKTQGVMMQMSYVSVGPRALRRLGGEFMNGVGYLSSKAGSSRKLAGQEVTVGKSTGKSKPRNVTKEGYK